MEVKKSVGQRLSLARKAAGYTQEQTATKLRMLRQAYARYENGIFELNYEQMITL
ncbi:MAG: helix-turn-helix transcriptional regulator [Clostridia bacterium]|nr:helix-turn-helix transcriptional regulator [Clostridia bacterium]